MKVGSVKVTVSNGDIVEYQADALIYSTNKEMHLSGGGVGAALVEKYGYEIQDRTYRLMTSKEKDHAELGDVFECSLPDMTWKKVFHTLVTNDHYNTRPDAVKAVLKKCFTMCEASRAVNTIVVSALGCGYGDLSHTEFVHLVKDVCQDFQAGHLSEVIICCKNLKFYEEMCLAL